MRTFRFVAGWFGGTCGKFLSPVEYIQGQGRPRFPVVVGDGTNRIQYVYDPVNEIQVEIDPSQDKENANFVRVAKDAVKKDTPQLLLVTEDGTSLRAVVWEMEEGNPVRIGIQPDDGTW